MDLEVKIGIYGNRVQLELTDVVLGGILDKTVWEDKRDLSQKLFQKIENLLRRNKLSLKDIHKLIFDCDSPYFSAEKKHGGLKMENINSSGKCGFTAWQTGEIIVKAINFALEK